MAEGVQHICRRCHFPTDHLDHQQICQLAIHVSALRALRAYPVTTHFVHLFHQAAEILYLSRKGETRMLQTFHETVSYSYDYLIAARIRSPLTDSQINNIRVVLVTKEQITSFPKCCICLEEYTIFESVKQLPCFHFYHKHCIVQWLRESGRCPICMNYINPDSKCEDIIDEQSAELAMLVRDDILEIWVELLHLTNLEHQRRMGGNRQPNDP